MGGGASQEKLAQAEKERAKQRSENEDLRAQVAETTQALQSTEASMKTRASDMKMALRDAVAIRIRLTSEQSRCEKSLERLREVEEVELGERQVQLATTQNELAQTTTELQMVQKELALMKQKAKDVDLELRTTTQARKDAESALAELSTGHSALQREHRATQDALDRVSVDLEFAKVGETKAFALEEKSRRVAEQALRDQRVAERETLDARAQALTVEADLGEVRATRDAAHCRYDVVAAELRCVEKSAGDWRWLGETAQLELESLRAAQVKHTSNLDEARPLCEELERKLADARKELEESKREKDELFAQMVPTATELGRARKELEFARSRAEELKQHTHDRYKLAITASQSGRVATKETTMWRQLGQSTKKDLESFLKRKQLEVRDREALSSENRCQFEAQAKICDNVGQRIADIASRSLPLNPKAEAKQLEDTLQMLTLQTTELNLARSQGLASLRSPLLFGQAERAGAILPHGVVPM